MKYKILILSLVISINIFPQVKTDMEKIKTLFEMVKNEYAPDKRTAIFDVNISEDDGIFTLTGETNLPEAKNILLKQVSDYKIKDELKLLPDEKLGNNIYGIVNISVGNVRTKPENSAEMATQALLGTTLKVFKQKGGWFLVQTPDDYIGWLDDDAFIVADKNKIEEYNNCEKVIVTNNYGTSFSENDEKSIPVSDVVAGNILKYLNDEINFTKVEYPDGRLAYIPSSGVDVYSSWLKKIKLTQNNLIATAKSLMGLPYLWGGTSTKGVDCSGFTKTIYFLNGVMLPRDASQQVHVGELIDTENGFDNLQPGDLLFFGTKESETQKEKVVHVGMYIGNMEFIHSSGMVRINSLDSTKQNFNEYRFRTFIRARRILSSLDTNGVKLLSTHLFN